MSDRTIHAAYDDWEVVRYDRASKWYVEGRGPQEGRRMQVPLWLAVETARDHDAEVFYGRPGGTTFDRRLKALEGR